MIISMRVLIVEDDHNLVETINPLEESGYAVDGFGRIIRADMVSA